MYQFIRVEYCAFIAGGKQLCERSEFMNYRFNKCRHEHDLKMYLFESDLLLDRDMFGILQSV